MFKIRLSYYVPHYLKWKKQKLFIPTTVRKQQSWQTYSKLTKWQKNTFFPSKSPCHHRSGANYPIACKSFLLSSVFSAVCQASNSFMDLMKALNPCLETIPHNFRCLGYVWTVWISVPLNGNSCQTFWEYVSEFFVTWLTMELISTRNIENLRRGTKMKSYLPIIFDLIRKNLPKGVNSGNTNFTSNLGRTGWASKQMAAIFRQDLRFCIIPLHWLHQRAPFIIKLCCSGHYPKNAHTAWRKER